MVDEANLKIAQGVVSQNVMPAPDTEPTATAEVVEEPPSPTPKPTLDSEPSEHATEWTTLVSDIVPISAKEGSGMDQLYGSILTVAGM